MIGHSLFGAVAATHAEARAFSKGLGFLYGGELESDAPCKVVRLSDPMDDFAVLLAVCGPGWERAERAARTLLKSGADGLMSVGVAGGLAPDLACGDVVVARSVLDGDAAPGAGERVKCVRRALLPSNLEDVGVRPWLGDVATCRRVVLTPGDKEKLFHTTRALAVDMESLAVGRVADESGMLFLAARSVADTASDEIPKELLAGLSPDGRLKPLGVALAMLKKPGLAKAAFHLARQSRRALKSLGLAAPELAWHAKMLLAG